MATKRSPQQPTPRWLYSILNWMENTPLNGVLAAFGIFLVGILLSHWPQWQTGRLAPFQLNSQLLFEATWLPSNLLFWIWLDRIAHTAVTNFALGISKTKQQAHVIYLDFVSIRPSVALVLLILGLFFSLGNVITSGQIVDNNPLFALAVAGPVLGGVMELFSVFRLLRQLLKVNTLYRTVGRVNLFNLWPIYSLSRYGYTVALLFIVATVLIDFAFISLGIQGIGFAYLIYTIVISLVVFLAPLLGINNRLRAEKAQELQRLGDQLNSVYNETEAAVRSRKLAKVGALRTASAALREQIDSVQKVATWPWNPGSLRNLLLPVLLPLFLAVLQRYLLTFLGF